LKVGYCDLSVEICLINGTRHEVSRIKLRNSEDLKKYYVYRTLDCGINIIFRHCDKSK